VFTYFLGIVLYNIFNYFIIYYTDIQLLLRRSLYFIHCYVYIIVIITARLFCGKQQKNPSLCAAITMLSYTPRSDAYGFFDIFYFYLNIYIYIHLEPQLGLSISRISSAVHFSLLWDVLARFRAHDVH